MRRAAAIACLLLLTACSKDQDPGIVPPGQTDGSSTTSHVLEPCPPGGPDGDTPAAGCLDADGNVVHAGT